MGKAARNRRNRQRQSRATERLKKRGSTGYLRGDSAEARELFAQVSAETEMPCRATFVDDPLFGGHPARVTGTTPEGGLLTDTSLEVGRMPVLLFEPVHALAVKDPVTGLTHEARTDVLVATGWQRVPSQFLMAGLPADGWGLYRTATGVELRDPYGCVFAEGRLALDPEWVSAAVSTRAVMVFIGPRLGVRVPPGRTPESYTPQARALEFREGRRDGLLAAATVKWHNSPPRNRDLGPAGGERAQSAVPASRIRAAAEPQGTWRPPGPRLHRPVQIRLQTAGHPRCPWAGRPADQRRRGPDPGQMMTRVASSPAISIPAALATSVSPPGERPPPGTAASWSSPDPGNSCPTRTAPTSRT